MLTNPLASLADRLRPFLQSPTARRLNAAAIALVVALGAVAVLLAFDASYPVVKWFLPRVIAYHLTVGAWALGCLGLGSLVMFRLRDRAWTDGERLVLGFPLGVVAFGLVTFLAGLFHALGVAFFVLAPLAFVVAGSSTLWRVIRPMVGEVRKGVESRSWGLLPRAGLVFGILGLIVVYLPILTPQNMQYDAAWYHLPIAQQYAVEGAIGPFEEGWYLASYPHLASLLYAWCWLAPVSVFDRMLLCAHLEFYVLLATVFALPAVVRRVEPRASGRLAWVVAFLFPGIFVYDASLGLGADHLTALFAPSLLLGVVVAWSKLSVRQCVVVGLLAAGAAWTKYSAVSLVLPVVAALWTRALWLAVRPGGDAPGSRVQPVLAAAAMSAAFTVGWAPHWLPNWLWHGDPLYPLLHAYLDVHPWSADGQMYFADFNQNVVWNVSHDAKGLLEAAGAALTVGFKVRDYDFHGAEPTFGFLFALTLPLLPFVRPNRRVWMAFGLSVAGVITWMWVYHRDRYLQGLAPWMMVGVAAVLALLWQRGRVERLAAVVLVGVQIAVAVDLPLYPAHRMSKGHHPLDALIRHVELARSKPDGWASEEMMPGRAWLEMRDAIPEDGRVLIHDERSWVGLDRSVVVDDPYGQAGIRYGEMEDTRAVHEFLRGRGVTHIITGKHHDVGTQSIAGQLLFWDYVHRHAMEVKKARGLTLWQVAQEAPEPGGDAEVLMLACKDAPPTGVYALEDLARVSEPPDKPRTSLPAKSGALWTLAKKARFAVANSKKDGCSAPSLSLGALGFTKIYSRGGIDYWSRKPTERP